MKTDIHILIISRSILLRMRNVSVKSCREDQNKHFVLNSFFFPSENRAVYEIMWRNTERPDRQQMTIWRMGIAFWIPKTTHTHTHTHTHKLSICNTYCFPLHQWLH
jgi:hypothetical protein